MTVEIWHNPRCSKSRAALAILRDAGVELRVRRYLEDPPTEEELDRVLDLLGMEPRELTRMNEAPARSLDLAGRERSRDEWIRALVRNPILIQRPVVLTDDGRAALGRPPENVEELIG